MPRENNQIIRLVPKDLFFRFNWNPSPGRQGAMLIFIDITNHVNIIKPKTTVLQYHVAFRGSAKSTNPFPFFLRLFDKILRGMLVLLSFMRKLLVGLKACESFAVFGCDLPVSHVLDISMP